MTFQLLPQSITGGAVCKRDVIICNIIEEMNFILFEHQASSNGVDRRVSPALIEESTILIKGIKVVGISL